MDKLVGIQEHATKHCEPVLLDELEAEGLLFRSGKPTKGELVSPADLCVSIVAGLAQEPLACAITNELLSMPRAWSGETVDSRRGAGKALSGQSNCPRSPTLTARTL